MRRLLYWSTYVGFLVGCVVLAAYVRYRLYVRSITPARFSEMTPVAGLDARTLARTGAIPRMEDRRTSFARFPRTKPSGVIRLGCFGDSFTWGTEVGDGQDWPAVLGELLNARDGAPVEVLNFGAPGHGFHQMHLMWETVGSRWSLDAAIFLPLPTVWGGRDTSFTFWEPPAATLGFHARFVLDGDNVALVEPLGETESERFAIYNRFLPPLRYLRYDQRPPAALRALLPAGRTLGNPFYYERGASTEESRRTYRLLLARLARAPVPMLLADAEGTVAPLVNGAAPGALRIADTPVPASFLYRAPQNHYSAWGNRLLAEQVARAVVGGSGGAVALIELDDLPPAAPAPDAPAPPAAGSYERITVGLDDLRVGALFETRRGTYAVRPVDRLPAETGLLLGIPVEGGTFIDGIFLPLPTTSRSPAVALRADGTTRHLEGPIGLKTGIPVYRLDLCSAATLAVLNTSPASGRCSLVPPWGRLLLPGRAELLADNHVIVDVGYDPRDGRLELLPRGVAYRPRLTGDPTPRPEALGPGGQVVLVLERAHAAPERVPVAAWRRIERDVRVDEPLVLPDSRPD